jgi:hypothetical protein
MDAVRMTFAECCKILKTGMSMEQALFLGRVTDLSILPQGTAESNRACFCSSRGLVSGKTVVILENGLCAVIHQSFVAPGVKMCEYRPDAKTATSTETRQNLL